MINRIEEIRKEIRKDIRGFIEKKYLDKDKVKKAIGKLIPHDWKWDDNWVITQKDYEKLKKESGLK